MAGRCIAHAPERFGVAFPALARGIRQASRRSANNAHCGMEIANTAAASAPEAPNSPVTSNSVPVTVNLGAKAAATVTVITEQPFFWLYLPVILREE